MTRKKYTLGKLTLALLVLSLLVTGCVQAAKPQVYGEGTNTVTAKDGEPLPGAKPDQSSYTFGVAIANLPDPFFVSVYYGMEQKAKELGINLVLADAGGWSNLDKQVSQLQDFIVKGVDGIVGNFIDPAGTEPVVAKAWEANIPVIGFASSTNGQLISFLGSSQEEIGQEQASYIIEALTEKYGEPKGKVAMINGPAGATWAVLRAQAFREMMAAEAPGVVIVDEQWGESSRDFGMDVMQDLITRFGDELDAVYTGSDTMGVGAARALKSANYAGKIVLTTAVMEKDTEQLIRENVISASAAQQSTLIGEATIQALYDYLQNKPQESKITIPIYTVTAENIETAPIDKIRAPDGYRP